MGAVKSQGTSDLSELKFNAFVEQLKEGTLWNTSRVTLALEKPQFIGSPVKHVIDLAKTKLSPALQSITFPTIPTPPNHGITTTVKCGWRVGCDKSVLRRSIVEVEVIFSHFVRKDLKTK